MDPAATLAAIPLFGGLSKERASDLAAASHLRRCDAGQSVVNEGDEGYSMYVVLRGRVAVSRLNDFGERVLFHELGPGEFFGEMSLLAGINRTADVTTVRTSQFLVIEREAFMRCVLGSPEVAMRIISHLVRRVHQADTARIAKRTVRQRLVEALLNLAVPFNDDKPTASTMVVEVSKTALGERILARRETVSRELSNLAREEYIQLCGKQIFIPNFEQLQDLVR